MMIVQASAFDEPAFFAALARVGARVLLIGRRALAALGIPVLTADYDLWIHADDAALVNAAAAAFDLVPSRAPEAARQHDRYVLENDEHVDVLVARAITTIDGVELAFDDLYARRRPLELEPGVTICVPALDDLIATKRVGGRPRDLEDIRLLEALREEEP